MPDVISDHQVLIYQRLSNRLDGIVKEPEDDWATLTATNAPSARER